MTHPRSAQKLCKDSISDWKVDLLGGISAYEPDCRYGRYASFFEAGTIMPGPQAVKESAARSRGD
jgi:hypothetical protein